MLSMFCHIFDPTTAIACCLAERRRGERDGYGHPQVWATYLPSLDEPTENWCSVGQWSAHADVTVAEPWEYWIAATAEAQESFAAALLAAGECTAVQTGKRAVLRGFRDQTPARIAGAILSDLAWGHTDVALECAALLRRQAEREAA